MPDISINYELLNQLGKQTEQLRGQISDALSSPPLGDAGNARANSDIGTFDAAWSSAFQNAGDVLESLSTTYTFVAQQWFDQDASFAGNANEQALGYQHAVWQMEEAAFTDWQKANQGQPPDPSNPAPPDPGPEPTSLTTTAADGSLHTTTSTFNPDGSVASNDTTITDGAGGMQYHEHTTFGANGSYTSTVQNTDGSSMTNTVTGNADGTGTETVITTDPQGNTTTTNYTGTGVNGPNPVWTPVTTPGSDGGSGSPSDTRPNSGEQSNKGPQID